MAADLRRFLEGRTVLARPSIYATTLGSRVRPHLDHIGEWLRLRLIYPHEAERLHAAYRALDAREDDWIVESRTLSYTQIALYLGAFLLVCGSLFYFAADRWYEAVDGVARPFAVLGLPFVGLNAAAHLLYRKDHKAVAVAFYLAAVALLPLFLLILFHETGLLVAAPGTPGQLFAGGSASNHQLQVTTAVACAWCGFAGAADADRGAQHGVHGARVPADDRGRLGLRAARRGSIEARWDRLALHLFPLVGVYAALGAMAERTGRPWFSRPLYLGSAVLLVAVLELLALDGRAWHYLGLSLRAFQSASVSDPTLLDTVTAHDDQRRGLLRGGGRARAARLGAGPDRGAAPLQPSRRSRCCTRSATWSAAMSIRRGCDWIYAACAAVIILLSHRRQRRSFYYAGLINLGAALYLVAAHREWFGRPAWAMALIAAGLAMLAAGFALDRRERTGPRD